MARFQNIDEDGDSASNEVLSGMKIGFLYNHEVPHQVAHTAPILKEMLLRYPHLDISVLSSTDEQKQLVEEHLGETLTEKTPFVDLKTGLAEKRLLRLVGSVAPSRRLAVLKENLDVLRKFDVLVVPESTSLLLKKQFGLDHLKFVLTHHGAGDRSVAQKKSIRDFDFVLVAGKKDERRHKQHGLIRDGFYAKVGYPKFDFVRHDGEGLKLFDNQNPTVVYNPHFDPHLSSWFKMGRDVLDVFLANPDLNLIFAPHIMLFKRRVHTSLDYKVVRWRSNLKKHYAKAPNIHIDLGSLRSVDMSYTRAADIYLGDVSSQIYEFLEKRRPVIFLNSHEADWEDNPYYSNWKMGPVVESTQGLADLVRSSSQMHAQYLHSQQAAYNDTFEITEEKSCARAAIAIGEFVLKQQETEQLGLAAAE